MSRKVFCPIIHNGLGMVMSEYMVSFLAAMDGRAYTVEHIGDSLASRAMNRISATFLESDCDEMFVWDTDINATKQDVTNLFSHDLKLVFGFYPIKKLGLDLCASHESGEFPVTTEPLVEMRRSGRGFVRIHREVFERMKAENGGRALPYYNHGRTEWDFWSPGVYQPPRAVLPDEYLCENWAFCEHARELGYPIWCDQRISLQHRGLINFPVPGSYETRPREAWEFLPGWFNYRQLYQRIAATLTDGSHFCEVGVWMGKSLGAMASFCKGKDVTFHAVDTFKGSQSGVDAEIQEAVVESHGGSIRAQFEENMRKCGLNGNLRVIEGDSFTTGMNFTEELDAVFIDADHSLEAVAADITAWLPCVKPGGIIAGHDYERPSVREAVHAAFPESEVETVGMCWVYTKPK